MHFRNVTAKGSRFAKLLAAVPADILNRLLVYSFGVQLLLDKKDLTDTVI